jgi:ubiquinone/menaquinone biosynthesis C-methylase UbiE
VAPKRDRGCSALDKKDLLFRRETKQHYDSLALSYQKLQQPYGAQRRRDAVLDLCGGRGICFALDAGSADGMMSARLLDLGWAVTAVDISRGLCKLAQVRGISAVVGDLENMPFRNCTFDVVVCTEVFEHLANYRRAAGEIGRITKSMGRVVISVPNPLWEPLFKIADNLRMKVPEKTKRLVTLSGAMAVMRQSGFIILEQRGVILWPFSKPQFIQRISIKMESKLPRLCATLISMYSKQ